MAELFTYAVHDAFLASVPERVRVLQLAGERLIGDSKILMPPMIVGKGSWQSIEGVALALVGECPVT